MNQNDQFSYLFEIELTVREITAQGIRYKSLCHGYISTLHLWLARRPLGLSVGKIVNKGKQ